MSRYLLIDLKWSFLTKEGRAQWKSLIYRIYINIFGIFLRIKLLPLSIDKRGIWLYYKGDEIYYKYYWKRKNKNDKWISLNFSGTGEWGDAIFSTLESMNEAWNEHFDDCARISEKEDKEYLKNEKYIYEKKFTAEWKNK